MYTPVEVVDFIVHSADHVLRREFGRGLGDKGVHILDPFTGTGIFLVRLLQSGLISDTDLARKYRKELHANEIVLLAYYIAAIHIEEASHGRGGPGRDYEPFEGIVLTDTFNLHQEQNGYLPYWLPDNSKRAARQQQTPIQVIVGNPPWSAGQRSSADNNPNVDYPALESRVAATYAARSRATLKNSLYDAYKMAIRWASDRIGEQGIIAFVTNGSWIDGNADSGVRACLAEEFTSIYVLNLRGNTRTSGERGRREGQNVFWAGSRPTSRATVAITILVRNPSAAHEGCRILYRDIGDYLKREAKLGILREAGSVAGIENWRTIEPDRHHDWISQRSEAFQTFYPLGTKAAKAGKADDAVFKLFSNGFKTGRDAYMYNFSRAACAENARKMVGDYLGALQELKGRRLPASELDAIASRHSAHVRWDPSLKSKLRQGNAVTYSRDRIWTVPYRPFVRQNCYVDYRLVQRKAQQDSIFPAGDSKNCAICVPGVGSTKPFSVLVVDAMPDLHFMAFGQCFPRYGYLKPPNAQRRLPGLAQERKRVDNITDTARRAFQVHYKDDSITKDEIFDYIYGVLHAPAYRERFASDLAKELPRIPLAPDFRTFAAAGRELTQLHLGYERCDEYPLELGCDRPEGPRAQHVRIGRKKMKWTDRELRTELVINEHLRLKGIPTAAHQYEVNGRTPIEWFIDRYRIVQDRRSGLVNDPNGWFEDPRDLIRAICRIVHVSVETVRIVENLPEPIAKDQRGK